MYVPFPVIHPFRQITPITANFTNKGPGRHYEYRYYVTRRADIVTVHSNKHRLWLLATALVFASSQALALEINNNTAYKLKVSVTCGKAKDTFSIGPDQVGDCPSNVCTFGATCSYKIDASGDGSCSGTINAGSGLQVDDGGKTIQCQSYGG